MWATQHAFLFPCFIGFHLQSAFTFGRRCALLLQFLEFPGWDWIKTLSAKIELMTFDGIMATEHWKLGWSLTIGWLTNHWLVHFLPLYCGYGQKLRKQVNGGSFLLFLVPPLHSTCHVSVGLHANNALSSTHYKIRDKVHASHTLYAVVYLQSKKSSFDYPYLNKLHRFLTWSYTENSTRVVILCKTTWNIQKTEIKAKYRANNVSTMSLKCIRFADAAKLARMFQA